MPVLSRRKPLYIEHFFYLSYLVQIKQETRPKAGVGGSSYTRDRHHTYTPAKSSDTFRDGKEIRLYQLGREH